MLLNMTSSIKSLPHFFRHFHSFFFNMAEKRSLVWKYFSMVENNGKKKAKCNLCHSEVSYSRGSTGTMSNHLKHIHKSINVDVASSQPKMAQSRITDFKKTPVLNMPKPKWQNIRILYVCRVEIEDSNPRNDLADRNRGLRRFRSARSFRGLETSISTRHTYKILFLAYHH